MRPSAEYPADKLSTLVVSFKTIISNQDTDRTEGYINVGNKKVSASAV